MQPPEIVLVDADETTVGCDGGNGPLGHPLVYYEFGAGDAVDCGYCGRRFVRRGTAAGAAVAEPDGHKAAS